MHRASLLMLLTLAGAVDARAAEISFHPTLEAARKASEAKSPVVVVFGASWCGWCRKMEADTFADPRVLAVAARYQWVKIDIDEQKEIASRFRVRGVPATILLGAEDEVIASRPGYLPPEKFLEFLTGDHSKPEQQKPERKPRVEPESEEETSLLAELLIGELKSGEAEPVRDLVDLLARADRSHRRRILASLSDAGRTPWPVLFELMHDERLAIRAAAASALDNGTHAGLPFHPFAPEPKRAVQIASWKAWLESRGVGAPSPAAVAEIPTARPLAESEEPRDAPAEAEIPR